VKLQRTLYRQAKSKPKWKAWSLFDHTCPVFGGNILSVHSLDNCPTIVSGGGASIRLGEHMVLPKDTPLSNLWLTLL
jgi:hypothetical protein